MEEKIDTPTGKILKLPSRMFKSDDLIDMQISSVEENIFLNKTKPSIDFSTISSDVEKHMGVINYHDFSDTLFSEKLLIGSIRKQLKSNVDFIILPHFKNESAYDVRKKIELASKLKEKTSKGIILEISYKSEIDSQELIDNKEVFDFLSLFVGLHYGHFNQLRLLTKRIMEIKQTIGKRI